MKYWLALVPLTLFAADLKIDHVTVAGNDLKAMQQHLSSIGIETGPEKRVTKKKGKS